MRRYSLEAKMENVEKLSIPQGLRVTNLLYFIFTLIFGLAGTFAAKLVGDIAGHPVHDPDINGLLGVAALTFAFGSWQAYRAVKWEQISLVTAMLAFLNLLGGVLGLLAYFFPSLINATALPPVQLLVAVILTLFGLSFTYYYTRNEGWHTPLASK